MRSLTYYVGTGKFKRPHSGLTLRLGSLTFNPYSPALLDLFLSSDPSVCTTVALYPLGDSDHIAVSVPIDFPSNSKNPAFGYSCSDSYNMCNLLRDAPLEDTIKLGASATTELVNEPCWY